MHRAGIPVVAALAAIHLLIFQLGLAESAFAFAPEAAAAVAERIPSALPPAARWNPAWGAAAASQVVSRLEWEDGDPEAYAAWHRFVAGSSLAADDPGVAAGAGMILGIAPRRLAAAAAELRDAFAEGGDDRIVRGLADVAVSATDLADPFHVTSCDRDEVETARARFSDLLSAGDVAGLDPADWNPPGETLEAALSLAARSAEERRSVEDAVRTGNQSILPTLRRERLESALALARAVAVSAWLGAHSPSIATQGVPLGALRIRPNPVSAGATLSFHLPAPGEARVELFDAAGRQVWSRGLGFRPAGLQGTAFGPGTLSALPPGIYIVRIATASYHVTGRLVHIHD